MQLVGRVLGLIVPHDCLLCGQEGELLCDGCLHTELLPLPPRCYRCQQASPDGSVCRRCRRQVALRHVWAFTAYDDKSSPLLLKFKYERARAAYRPIAKGLVASVPFLNADTLVVGVPTATSRVRQRGFDHSELLVRAFAESTGLAYARPIARFGQSHQFGATRDQRRQQLKDAFYVVEPQAVIGRNILLLDDVVTTGATLETLGMLLKEAGAKRVDAVVFAQKL